MKLSLRNLSLKNKLLIVLSTLPIASIALIVVMATNLLKNDKLAYVYDTALSSARAKASTADSQINSHIQSLKAINANFDPQRFKVTENGLNFFKAEDSVKAFLTFQWDGKEFQEKFNISKDVDFNEEEKQALVPLLQETWFSGFTVGVSKQYPMHIYLLARTGESSLISALLVENTNFFALFGSDASGEAFLFHRMRGKVIGEEKFPGLTSYLSNNVFNQKFHEGTKEAKFSSETYLTSYSKIGQGDLYVVSLLDKTKALLAVRTLIRRSILFTGIILCVLIFIGVFASSGLTKTLRGLAEATSKVMDGDFTVRVEQKNEDEIGSLAKSFNKMTEEVSRLMEKTAENARMEAELQTAQTVQDTLFPKNDAQIGPFVLYGDSVPASECGGDWWHYSQVGNKLYVWIGDATGHGVPAALLTSAARAVASVIEEIENVSPAKALKILNRAIYSTSKGEMMMTFFLACFDMENNTLTYSNASHDPPYLLKNTIDGKPKRKDFFPLMENNNPRLGEKEGSEYSDFVMEIEEGDKIVFYTDGIVDVRSPEGELWGERRFLKSLSGINSEDVDQTVGGVFTTLNDFRKDTPLDDDVTLVIIEYLKDKKAAA